MENMNAKSKEELDKLITEIEALREYLDDISAGIYDAANLDGLTQDESDEICNFESDFSAISNQLDEFIKDWLKDFPKMEAKK